MNTKVSNTNQKETKQPSKHTPVAAKPKTIGFMKFFKYLTFSEKILFFWGILGTIVAACVFPALAILLGQIINIFGDATSANQALEKM